ncbi:hypothetical protein RFI_36750 [Reticulomyxa filosa]|uniref:Uncharacterized protein n=1 Tax=Reticulomyxa filosa TaxID=46433 RepID=X6LIZ5_RETFI|nr:hypothetical protein RFI_36750 [Reticulomyxa filosa]|eukprot:ETO00690.1 hypothetical protein RFI_36750 [Reticulomyxa filosa]
MAESNEVQESIHKYLRDELKIKSDDALKVASYLSSLGVTETSDIAYVIPEDWEKLFKDVEVAPISKRKLLAKMDEVRSKKTPACPAQMYLSTFFLCVLIAKKKKKKNETVVTFDVSDARWNTLNLRSGDEIFCVCAMNESKVAIISDIKFPVLYQSTVCQDDSQFLSVQLHCLKQVR